MTFNAPKADRQATNASLPIMGPPAQPIAYNFAPSGLSGAKLAAHNRAQRAAGILPAKPDKAAKPSPHAPARTDGLALVLTLSPGEGCMTAAFAFQVDGAQAAPELVPDGERALAHITATARRSAGGDLAPAERVEFRGTATADGLAAALSLMRRLDAALLSAYADTEDSSFPQMVLTLASVLRVDRIEATQLDGTTTTAKRGAAYITAFKAGELHRPA